MKNWILTILLLGTGLLAACRSKVEPEQSGFVSGDYAYIARDRQLHIVEVGRPDRPGIMLANGADKPVWITELAYTIGPGQHPSVTEKQQAEYLTATLLRTRREWPWVEVLTAWNLANGISADDEISGYSLVGPDLTRRLVYGKLQQLLSPSDS